jgi:VanZ family protein
MALIFVVSSMPHPPEPPAGLSILSDKALHVIVYAGLGTLLVRALVGGWLRPVSRHVALLAASIAVIYGAGDEIHQHFVPPRQMDALDLAADGIGALLAVFVCHLGGRSTSPPSEPQAGIIRRRHGL